MTKFKLTAKEKEQVKEFSLLPRWAQIKVATDLRAGKDVTVLRHPDHIEIVSIPTKKRKLREMA